MTNTDLAQLNEPQKKRDEAPYKNARNAAAGCIRLLDPRICAERGLRMFCHGTGDDDESVAGAVAGPIAGNIAASCSRHSTTLQ